VRREDIIRVPKDSETSGDLASDDSSLSQKDAQDKGGDSASDDSTLSQEEVQEKDLGDSDSSGAEASLDDSSLLQQKGTDKDGSQTGDPLGGDRSGAQREYYPDEEANQQKRANSDGAQREHYPDEEATQQKRTFSDGATIRPYATHPHAFSDLRHASHVSSGVSEVDIAKTVAANARRAVEYQVETIVDRTIGDALRKVNKAKE